MRTLTSKAVKTGIKNGFTVKDFCKKYGIQGEGNFMIQLEKAFPNGGCDQVLREIHQNEKSHRHTKRKPAASPVTTTPTPRKEAVVIKKSALEALEAKEAELSKQVIDLENQHKQLAGERRGYLQKLRSIQQKVDEICQELGKQQTAYEETANLNNGVVRQMNKISKVRAEKLAELTTVRGEITKLRTTIIAVYDDCGFEIVEGNTISLEPEQSEVGTLTHQLAELEICENLTIKQIKTLAKLILISKNTSSKTEFIFDSSDLEQAYLASKPLSP